MDPASDRNRQLTLSWVALWLAPGVGSTRFARLVDAFGSPGAALSAPAGRLMAAGMPGEVARAITGPGLMDAARRELERLDRLGAAVVTLDDPDYPPLLRSIYAPPPVLFVCGDLKPIRSGGVAVVGSRSYSPYGRRVAAELGRDLALAGVAVVSGLARGIDTFAQAAALKAGGYTVSVLGCGLDVAYPPENAGLAQEIAAGGALVSELPLGSPPGRGNFPVRNRIISGLSRAVVVVEGGIKSGSLITARHALDQGREVFAVPGPVGTPHSEGSHELLRQGASLLTSAQDLLEPGALMPLPPEAEPPPPADLPDAARELLELVGEVPVHADVLVRQSGMMPQEVSALLVNLELAGLVSALPGRSYVRARG